MKWQEWSYILGICLSLWTLSGCTDSSVSQAADPPQSETKPHHTADKGKRITRLFWADLDDKQMYWSDIRKGDQWTLEKKKVPGFPTLDPSRQNLVQMEMIDGMLLVGVRDDAGGGFQSGWVGIDSGVLEEPHGDHSHWKYERNPAVRRILLDDQQGNPAHLYQYDNKYFVANDQKNGFTVVTPDQLKESTVNGTFYEGGGNHITMAAVDGKVCYSSWIDGGGPNKGRVDVVSLDSPRHYSLTLPTGVIHGATTNSGRVFFAPADGICWLDSDTEVTRNPTDVTIHHIDLGRDVESGKPLRTGAFTNHRDWVIFTTGHEEASSLCLLKASSENPSVVKVPIETQEGLSLVTPVVAKAKTGKRYAFVFLDRKHGEGPEYLQIVDLDPNGDRDFSDATPVKRLTVGASAIDGHYGHHDISIDPSGRFAFIANPGDGRTDVLSLDSLEIEGQVKVGGKPGRMICTGTGSSTH